MNFDNTSHQLKNFLQHLKECRCADGLHKDYEFIKLERGNTFWPSDFCLHLGLKDRFTESVPYFNRNEDTKKVYGINPELIKKIRLFLKKTGNEKFMSKAEKFFY